MGMTRRQPLRAMPRGKGNRFERVVVDLLRAHGWTHAHRNFGSGSQGGGDIVGGPEGVNIECKHVEALNIWKALAQSEADARPTDIPVVFFKRNRSTVYAALPADELLALLRFRERS